MTSWISMIVFLPQMLKQIDTFQMYYIALDITSSEKRIR